MLEVYESRQTTPLPGPEIMNVGAADAISWNLKNILSPAVEESCDAYLMPSLYTLPILADVVSALEPEDQYFISPGRMRI